MTLKLCLHFFCAHWALWISNWAGDISLNLTDPLARSSLHTMTAVKGDPTSCLYVNHPRDLEAPEQGTLQQVMSWQDRGLCFLQLAWRGQAAATTWT
jgi:hypothetical protein